MARLRLRTIVLLTFAVLLAGEVAVRVLLDASSAWNVRLGAVKRFDERTLFRLRSNYEVSPGIFTNEHGYLAPPNMSFEKPGDRLRIIYLGDSASVLPVGSNYPAQTEKVLAEHGVRAETLNAAVPGFDSGKARTLFEDEIQRYDADILLVYIGWNDLGQYGPEGLPYKRTKVGYEISAAQRLFSEVYLARFLLAAQDFRRRRQAAVDEPLPAAEQQLYDAYYPSHFEENLRAILRLGKQRYPKVAVMNLASITSEHPTEWELRTAHFPTGMSKNMRKLDKLVMTYNGVVDTVAREESVELIDIHHIFDSEQARRDFSDSAHMHEAGARRMAEAAAAVVLRSPAAASAR